MEQLETIYTKLGPNEKPDDAHLDKLGRISVLNWMCLLGHEDCLSKMEGKLMNEATITPDSQDPVYCGAMRNGNDEAFAKLLDLYKNSSTEELQRNRIVSGLACSSKESHLMR